MIRSLPNGPDRIEGAEQSIAHRTVAESAFILKSAGRLVERTKASLGWKLLKIQASAHIIIVFDLFSSQYVRFQFERARQLTPLMS